MGSKSFSHLINVEVGTENGEFISIGGITCRIVTLNLNGVIILQVESYRGTVVQVVNICLNFAIQDIICSRETNLYNLYKQSRQFFECR